MTEPLYETFSFDEALTAILGTKGRGFVLGANGNIVGEILRMGLEEYIAVESGGDEDERNLFLRWVREGEIRGIEIPQATNVGSQEKVGYTVSQLLESIGSIPLNAYIAACNEYKLRLNSTESWEGIAGLQEEIADKYGLDDRIDIINIDIDDGLLRGLITYSQHKSKVGNMPINDMTLPPKRDNGI